MTPLLYFVDDSSKVACMTGIRGLHSLVGHCEHIQFLNAMFIFYSETER